MSINIEKYLFVPFKDRGRDMRGADCRGLIGMVVKDLWDLDIPDAKVAVANKSEVNEAIKKLNDWKKIEKPTEDKPCIILFCIEERGQIDHMGLYIGGGKFFHTSSMMGRPSTASIFDPYWNYVREGYYVPNE